MSDLERHVKTRTLDEFIATNTPSNVDLHKLANAIHTFGSLRQCGALIDWVLASLHPETQLDLAQASIISVVLASLNFKMVSSHAVENIAAVRVRIDRTIRSLLTQSNRSESDHRGLCALLRVKYVLDRHVFVLDQARNDAGVLDGLILLNDKEHSLLVFELVRTAFLHIQFASRNGTPIEIQLFFDSLLAFVEQYYPRLKSNISWSGTDDDLSTRGRDGKTKCAIALVWMIVERWLPELDLLATPKQLRRFLDLVFHIGVEDLGTEKTVNTFVNPEGILLNILHSASFWELGRIRKELVQLLKEKTSPLSPGDVGLFKKRVSTFRMLLYFPLEYFSFQVLNGFVGCAVEVDGGISRQRDADEDLVKALVVLRVFVRRVSVFVGGRGVLIFRGKSEADLLLGMLEEPIFVDCDLDDEYLSASLDLAEVWLIRLLKSSKKTNDPEPVLRVLKAFSLDSICASHKRTLTSECFIRMVQLLDIGTPNAAAVHEDVLVALRVLKTELVQGFHARIVRKLAKEGLEDEGILRGYVALVRVWDSLICLGRCVGDLQQTPSRFLADRLVAVLMPYVQFRDALKDGLADLCVGVFGVTVGEAECSEQEVKGRRLKYLELVLATYVSWANKVPASGIKKMDDRLGRAAKRMAVSDFEHLLLFITESLSDTGQTACKSRLLLEARLTQLVRAGSLLIRDHPSHSMACIQKFMARCLGLFNDNPVYVEGDAMLRLRVLEMVGQYCSDQQGALCAQDTSLIWLLTFKILAPSQVHELDSQPEIFHKIVSILMCLIRLRRDLVTLGLPHLGLILRRMVQALRGCRPNLGAKQMAIVMNTQPRWISHIHSLGGGEAKALSRLLESLTLKTTVRVAFNNADSLNATKAESLAKPFSKHAAYVLKAYVEAMNDPLCVLSLEIRKELREGLFALCGMMSVHSRDALMVGGGLDAGGKWVLKSVWKEWEEVRYVGKG